MSTEEKSNLIPFLAGGFAGMTVDLVLFPLDAIKTRMQAARTGATYTLPKNFYAGLGSAMLGSFPAAAVFYGTYEYTKKTMKENYGSSMPSYLQYMVSASIAEVASSMVRVPFEVVKQQMQIGLATSSVACVQNIVRTAGIAGLWVGMGTTIARDIPFDCIQFSIWESAKVAIADPSKGETGENIALWKQGLLGAFAGGIAASVTTPLDVAKTRLMTQQDGKYKGMMHCLKTIAKEEGWRNLFLGIKPRVGWISFGGFIYLGGCRSYDYLLSQFLKN